MESNYPSPPVGKNGQFVAENWWIQIQFLITKKFPASIDFKINTVDYLPLKTTKTPCILDLQLMQFTLGRTYAAVTNVIVWLSQIGDCRRSTPAMVTNPQRRYASYKIMLMSWKPVFNITRLQPIICLIKVPITLWHLPLKFCEDVFPTNAIDCDVITSSFCILPLHGRR